MDKGGRGVPRPHTGLIDSARNAEMQQWNLMTFTTVQKDKLSAFV